ncbi:RNA polymerase sigma factor SigI [Amycolatopsis sp. GM8]|uniref:RNA polymerase sigma factor SigI n=1 Tax=Amycolatopsis sp. GM8 TaxID=2896530 RepID=UPI001F25FEB2|nr:RNA polymerase sigma factor SigI [Amycolatopsis sp. GM8]
MYEPSDDRFAEVWRSSRAYLTDVAFRMLGDIGTAEDVVQEAFVRLSRTEPGEIDDERGWLTVVTGRLCLDHIRSARSRRERTQDSAVLESMAPVAPDPADRITLDDNVRTALFVVLERLSPAERVAFVLHDVFQLPFESIAETLGRPVTTCRQLARRARQKIAGEPGRVHEVVPAEHRLVTEKFITACYNGDFGALLSVLHPDAWGIAEPLPGAPFGPQVSRGRESVAHNLVHFYQGLSLVSVPPTVLCYAGQELFAVLTLTVTGDVITKLHATIDPLVWLSVRREQS